MTPGDRIAMEVFAGIVEAARQTGTGQRLVGTLVSPGKPTGQGYNVTTGDPVEQEVAVVLSEYSAREIDGTIIQAQDRRVLMSAIGETGSRLNPAPTVNDELRVSGDTFNVQGSMATAPAGVPLLFRLQVRR